MPFYWLCRPAVFTVSIASTAQASGCRRKSCWVPTLKCWAIGRGRHGANPEAAAQAWRWSEYPG